jgi:GDPmannose 4,6-dehydratase
MKKALISGITGQDGSYLADLLLHLGYEVHGIVRPSSTFNRSRIDYLINNQKSKNSLTLHYGDISDSTSIRNILLKVKPDEFYNLAAQSHVGISYKMPDYSTRVNGHSVGNVLETLKTLNLDLKFYQASTSEMFGSTSPPQSLNSKFAPQSPYASAKLFAYNMCQNYKDSYGMHISCGILFNHESFRRGKNFVTKKIISSLVQITNGREKVLKLGNLESSRDWGWAPEYVVAMWQMLQLDTPLNLIVGTGISASIGDFLNYSCDLLGLEPEKILEIDDSYLRPSEVDALCANTNEMKNVLGWTPNVDWKLLAKIMIEDELANNERNIIWTKLT